jgi:chaperone BCS1
MNAFNGANTLPIHSIPSHQISILDAFFPGFTGISASVQQLLAGNTDGFAHLLCICGILLFLVRYGYRYSMELVEAYFSL